MRRLNIFFWGGLAILTHGCTLTAEDLGENSESSKGGGGKAGGKSGGGAKGGTGGTASGGVGGVSGAAGASGSGAQAGSGGSSTGGVGGASGSGGAGGSGGGCNAPLPSGPKYYVDGSCSVDGDGLGDGCASSPGAPGAFRNPQSCFDLAQAGDTCLIKNGTYVTANNGSDPNENGGFAVAHSGAPGNPIVIRAYPGHAPLLANCAPGQSSYCPRPTISALGKSHVTFDCLRVIGGFSIYGDQDTQGSTLVPLDTGIVIQNNDVTQGWGEVGDGNWAGIWIGQQTNAHVHHNLIHDLSVQPGGGQQSSGTCIKLYHNTNALIEHNTCRHVVIPESQAGGIDDKAQAIDNVHRYNWIEDVNMCVRVNNQLNSSGVRIFGNVCIGGAGTQHPAIRLITNIDDVQIYNNTFYGFAAGLQIMNEGGSVTGAGFFNNIVANADTNIETYQAGLSASNFNAWQTGASWLYGGTWHSSLSAFTNATGFDSGSLQVDCAFVSPGTDFHLTSGSPCIAKGHTGGVASGASVDLGAYFDGVTCVGHGC